MKTIIKAILKFFKFSKLTFIGLFVLIFFSLSIFTVLNGTNVNLTNSYNTIATQGNLHDFVINENFRYGSGSYSLNTNKSNPDGDVDITQITNDGLDSTTNTTKYSVTFQLNESLIESGQTFEWTYAYLDIFNDYKQDQNFINNFVQYEVTDNIESTNNNVTLDNWTNVSDFATTVTSIVSNKSSELTTFVEQTYKQKFIDTVETETKTDIRDFNSLNISNTQQNIFFKLIESSPTYTIDKLVLYEGNNLTAAADFSAIDNIINATSDQLTSDASLSRNIVPFLYRAKWSNSMNFDALNQYCLDHPNYNPFTNQEDGASVTNYEVSTQSSILKNIINTSNGIINDGYQVKFSYSNLGIAPVSGYIEDFSSYGAVISTNYLQTLNKSPISIQDLNSHLNDTQDQFDSWISTLSNNTFQIDNQTFVILGAGISPDFMYPIVSFANLVPNQKSEQIVYTNSSGYSKMVNSFRGNEQETFLVGKFPTSNKNENKVILDKINVISNGYMSWPSNMAAAYMYNDTSNTISPTALRVIFIPQIVSTISNVSSFLTTFILFLSIVIAIVIIKRCIETNRNSLGIMQANGYKKREIILGMCLLILIPVLLASVLGYILGTSLQTVAISLLGSFWTLPTEISGISFVSMFLTLLVIAILFLALVIIFSSLCLRGETAEFMKDEAKYKMTKFASLLKKPFNKFSIIYILRSAIAFSSIWRLLLLSLMSALLVSSLTFSINILHSFSDAAQKTYGVRKYTYALNLLTPTLQSGSYYTVPYQEQGKTLDKSTYFNTSLAITDPSNSEDYITQEYWQNSSIYASDAASNSEFLQNLYNFGNYQLVSQDDLNNQKTDPYYLKNKTTTKAFTDINLGAGSISSNPWNLAAQLMPSNNSSYANQAYLNMFQNAVADYTTPISIEGLNNSSGAPITNLYTAVKSFSKAYAVLKSNVTSSDNLKPLYSDFGAGSPVISSQEDVVGNTSLFYDSIDSENDPNYSYYLQLDNDLVAGSNGISTKVNNIGFLNLLYYLYSDPEFSNYTYSINYNKIVVNQTDTPFSYINFNIDQVNSDEVNNTDSLNVTSISNDFTNPNIDLVNSNGVSLNKNLWTTPSSSMTINSQSATIYPIVINKYAQRKYDLNIGDIIKASVLNSADRYSRSYFGASDPIAYFKVIDIATTYQGAEFYINQYYANKILGLTINNIKPSVPTALDQIKDYVSWDNLEYDYGNSVTSSSSTTNIPNAVPTIDEFISTKSGFNGIFSSSTGDVPEVSSGVSLYSLSGIYPGTDLISPTNTVMKALFSNQTNMVKVIKQLGFNDLLSSDGTPNIDASTLIQKIADIFGTSSSFFIVSSASSITSTLDVLNTSSTTLTRIQVAFLSILIIITILIIVIISSLIINDSLKLAAILKCLGLDDKKNAASFLSVYLPVFFLGLIISIPITLIMCSVYVTFIFNFAGILIVANNAWWHFIVASIGIIVIFFLSYWTTWQKIGRMNLSKSIK